MQYVAWIVTGLTVFLVVATLLPFSKLRLGVVRAPAFLRQQMFWASVFLSVCAGFISNGQWLIAVLALTALVNLAYIVKFTKIWQRQSLDADEQLQGDAQCHISLLAANVKKSNRDYAALIGLIQKYQPHVVMAIEVDEDWIKGLEEALGDEYPQWIKVPKDTGYGICVMAKLPLSDTQVREIVTQGVPSVRTDVTLGCGETVRLYVVHPEPPVLGHDTKGRDSEIALIGIEASQDSLPVIVAGDLNDVAWSTTTRSFQRLSGLVDPRVGRGFYNTFNAFHWWARWPLDHLFHDPQFRLIRMARLEKIGSDHFPMLFDLALAEGPARENVTGEADVDERADIKAMIAQEKERARAPIGTDWED